MAKQMEDTKTPTQADEWDERQKALAAERERLEELAQKAEATLAKAQLGTAPAPELRLTAPGAKRPGHNKTFRVLSNSPAAKFQSVVVEGCCDESEAVRVVLHHHGHRDTHTIKCVCEKCDK